MVVSVIGIIYLYICVWLVEAGILLFAKHAVTVWDSKRIMRATPCLIVNVSFRLLMSGRKREQWVADIMYENRRISVPLFVQANGQLSNLRREYCICCNAQNINELQKWKRRNFSRKISFGKLVRIKGLEPPRLSAPDPKSDAATNYAISALVAATKIYIFFRTPIISCADKIKF